MKKGIIVIFGCLLISGPMMAQTFSITGFGGYTFQDKVNFSNAYGYINAGGHWGLSLEGINREGHAFEILYQQQNTHAPLYDYGSGFKLNPEKDNVALSYIMANALHYMMYNPRVQPYGGLGIGAAIIKSDGKDLIGTPYSESSTKFAWDAKLGVKIKAGDVVGIKLQAQIFSVVQAAGAGFYGGTGGSGAYVSSYSSIYQFAFTGGLCFDFAKK